jgi:hypothetical protein
MAERVGVKESSEGSATEERRKWRVAGGERRERGRRAFAGMTTFLLWKQDAMIEEGFIAKNAMENITLLHRLRSE